MKTLNIKRWAGAIACACTLGFVSQASAILITPATTAVLTGNETSQAAITAIVLPYIDPSTFLYKQDQGGPEEGDLAGSYTTTFSNTATDPEDALIEYDGGTIVGPTAYLLVKDGNSRPAWYLFNLTTLGWDGMEDLVLEGFWPGKGAISHVSLYGGTGTTVPDGGSMLVLLGSAVTVLGFFRRKISA